MVYMQSFIFLFIFIIGIHRNNKEEYTSVYTYTYHIVCIYYIHVLKQIVYVNYGAGTVLDFGVKAMDKESPCPNET